MFNFSFKNKDKNKGFTLIEMVVSIAIFGFMTAFVVSKYRNFSQSILLKNLTYDIAITIRTAQSYAVNIQSASRISDQFNYPYGVHFDSVANTFILFADTEDLGGGKYGNGRYNENVDTVISLNKIKPGYTLQLCGGQAITCTPQYTYADISYRRPSIRVNLCTTTDTGTGASWTCATAQNGAKVELRIVDQRGDVLPIIVNSVGQISVGRFLGTSPSPTQTL